MGRGTATASENALVESLHLVDMLSDAKFATQPGVPGLADPGRAIRFANQLRDLPGQLPVVPRRVQDSALAVDDDLGHAARP